jgi:hypothetical protein
MMFGMNPNTLLKVKVVLVTTVSRLLQSFLCYSGQITNFVSTKVMIKEQTELFPVILGLGCTLDVYVTRIAATDVLHYLLNGAVVKVVSGTGVSTAIDHPNVHRFIYSGRIISLSGHHGARANHI